MPTSSPQGRTLAMLASAAFVAGGLTILLGDVLTKPELWTSYHALTVLTVFGTIAAGHLMADASRARHFLAALGFLVLFLSGTGLVVYQSVGRQAETTDAKVYDAVAVNTQIANKGADLADAKKRRAYAERQADREMTGEICGRKCRDWRQNAKDIGIVQRELERDIAALGPQKPVAPKAEKMAAVAALFGADEAKAKAALMLLEPFLWTLFFEIGSIVSLGFAFRHTRTNEDSSVVENPEATFAAIKFNASRHVTFDPDLPDPSLFSGELPDPTPPKPRKRKSIKPVSNVVAFRPQHPVVQALESAGGSVASNRELARLQNISEGESSKRVDEVAHLLDVQKVGKTLHISLRKSA